MTGRTLAGLPLGEAMVAFYDGLLAGLKDVNLQKQREQLLINAASPLTSGLVRACLNNAPFSWCFNYCWHSIRLVLPTAAAQVEHWHQGPGAAIRHRDTSWSRGLPR